LGDDEFLWNNFNTTGLCEGLHFVEVKAIDAKGEEGSEQIEVFVDNRTDKYYAAKGIMWNMYNWPMSIVNYPNPEWGQEWTGSVFTAGQCSQGIETKILEILSKKVEINSSTEITFELLEASGGCYDSDCRRAVYITVIVYDEEDNFLAKAREYIYEYTTPEVIMTATGFVNNPDFKPEEGFLKKSIKPWKMISNKGVDMGRVAKWLVGITAINWQITPAEEGVPETNAIFEIKGLDFDMEQSASLSQEITEYPSGIINERRPSVRGFVTSTGGNITGVWGRYASQTASTWTLAIPVDGAFDSVSEEFIYAPGEDLEDGEHYIEIKSLNEQGEKDAVYSKFYFTVSNFISMEDIKTYVYPNPLRGVNPKIKVNCGVSNVNVKLKIYTITGELVHEKDISSFYNSSKNAYEYTWDTSGKASGVYIYLVEATKNGKTLKKTGKIGLIK